ncbi:MAG: UvrD-helicase domain-containing protein [Desulforegulaceae bacterium]|nr:UvrD-helicase domain-containing protein [Desulforegulaceae bacterium]
MEKFKNIISTEEKNLKDLIEVSEKVFSEEKSIREKISQEIKQLRREKLELLDFNEKNKIEKEIIRLQLQSSRYIFQDPKILRSPYFGILELEDHQLGKLSYKIGKKTIFGKDGEISVIDWREAPISRLFYEYESGEEYDEDIRGMERSGTINLKRRVGIKNRDLKSISEKDFTLVKDNLGTWAEKTQNESSSKRKEEQKNHCLPEITALISKDQFRAITLEPEKTFILQGSAGSGKTTIGLHRIAYMCYSYPEKFPPSKILVLMFNKSLQKYIEGVLPELGISGGVKSLTFHKFAFSILSKEKLVSKWRNGNPETFKIKKSGFAVKLVNSYCEKLFDKSLEWITDKFNEAGLNSSAEKVLEASSLDQFIKILNDFKISRPLSSNENLESKIASKLLSRLNNHSLDLYKMFTNEKFIEKTAKKENYKIDEKLIKTLVNSQKDFYSRGESDFADIGILIYLLQLKGVDSALPGYCHIMVDEAQDLSPAELAAVINASDDKKSVTICGDMAQAIKNDVYFDKQKGFAGFVREISSSNNFATAAETLKIGYRATREIMDLAWYIMKQKKDSSLNSRKGEPVSIKLTSSFDETIFRTKSFLVSHQLQRPDSLTCIICKFKKDADKVFEELKNHPEIKNIRRHEKDDFIFSPGIIVTNAHQVKGLEFSNVVFINPSISQFQDNDHDRMLLHVGFTRASEKLLIIGHEKMAYDLLNYTPEN